MLMLGINWRLSVRKGPIEMKRQIFKVSLGTPQPASVGKIMELRTRVNLWSLTLRLVPLPPVVTLGIRTLDVRQLWINMKIILMKDLSRLG